ncbi:MAG: FHA domain-containing protein, partial [Phycisphaerae bacterium]|nr:FHA domain-containing protein [Phycisphaerae bacterium]MDW8263158.1 FHA domain-containing protein [Phycisphaerales bacterium]
MPESLPMYLITVAGPAIGPFELKPQTPVMRIGRDPSCEIALPMREDRASRQHARFNFDGSRWRLTDLNSRWGTYLNGVRLAPETDLPLSEGDLV